MKLRGLSLQNKPIIFGVEDAPAIINDKMTILSNREMSPIIQSRTIMRGMDDESFFESDYVFDGDTHKLLGLVVYIDGFYIWNINTGELTPIRESMSLSYESSLNGYMLGKLNEIRSSIRFSCKGHLFRLNRIIFAQDKKLYIGVKSSTSIVDLDSIKFCTGNTDSKDILYFGQVLEDGIIELNDYHPMVKKYDNTYRELENDDYVKMDFTNGSDSRRCK